MMKAFITVCMVLMVCLQAFAQNTIQAKVSRFNSNKGVCRACLYDNAGAFNGKGKAIACIVVPVANKTAILQFTNIPNGTYAISVFHDANNNNKFDTNFIGIPTEGYGASGNKLPFAAAPGFNSNKFVLRDNQGIQLTIRLRYL